jgi:hypothetical protein
MRALTLRLSQILDDGLIIGMPERHVCKESTEIAAARPEAAHQL